MQTARLRVMLIITLSELTSDVQVTQMKANGTLEESGEAQRLRKSLEDMADESKSSDLLKECGLPENALVIIPEASADNRWSWSELKYLSDSLLLALDASLEHALLVSFLAIHVEIINCYYYFWSEHVCSQSIIFIPDEMLGVQGFSGICLVLVLP